MRKTLLVLKNEFFTTVSRPSFLLTLFGLPLVIGLVMGVIGLVNRSQPGGMEQILNPPQNPLPVGIVDQSGLIAEDRVPQQFIPFAEEASARLALSAGKISGFYIVPPDYLQTGNLIQIRAEYDPFNALQQSDGFQELLDQNLLGNDSTLIRSYEQPLAVTPVNENPEPEKARESEWSTLVPMFITIFFYILLLTSSSMLLNSITKEKENRVLEILMTSTDARKILTGKIIALALVGLLQTVVWLGAGTLLFGAGQDARMLPPGISLPVPLLAWGVVYFLGGYFLYASLMAGVGAMVEHVREASQVTTLIILPLIVPMVLSNNLIQAPDSPLALILSLFPLTSPVSMLARMSAGSVPTGQVVLGAVLLGAAAVWVLRVVSGFFRGQVLLGGQPFSRQRFLQALLGKVE